MRRRAASLPAGLPVVVARIERLLAEPGPPVVVAFDGRSGSGKSTLVARVAAAFESRVVPVDDFFAYEIPGSEWDDRDPEGRARGALDWRRLRDEALVPLREGRAASWRTYDFERGRLPDGRYVEKEEPVTCGPAPVILLDGAYSARPELAGYVDLKVLVEAPADVRRRRLTAREDPEHLERWERRWGAAEDAYFGRISPPESFDIVVSNDDAQPGDAS